MSAAAAAAAVMFWAYCGVMGVLVKGERPLFQNGLFQLSSVVAYFGLAGWVAWTFIHSGDPLMTVPGFVLVLILGVGLGARYLRFLVSEGIDRIHSVSTGIGTMTVRKTYDVAEKAEHDGELDRAMALYGEEAARDPKDPEPIRRMAELELRRGRTAAALEGFRRALPLIEEPEPRSTLSFRLSDLLAREGQGAEARRLLEDIAARFPDTRFAVYARERLKG